ncbi:MAG: AEC family transporter [Rhodospirillaceae bacterium]
MLSESLHHILLSAPLFLLILIGYAAMRAFKWPPAIADHLAKFVFNILVPALLFSTMSRFSSLPPVDSRLLLAFFGSCLIVFAIGRLVAWRLFALDGVSQSVFGVGCIFSNNVFLGIPLAKATLGEASLPAVSLVVAFNALILWTLVTVSVEWSLHGSLSLRGFAKMLRGVLLNPIIVSIVAGLAFDASGLSMPELVQAPLRMLAQSTSPMALVTLGMGLAKFGFKAGWREGSAIAAIKLSVQPAVVWLLAWMLDLPPLETQSIVMLASIAVGFNVYLMADQFGKLGAATASGIVLSTLLAAVTTPVAIALVR